MAGIHLGGSKYLGYLHYLSWVLTICMKKPEIPVEINRFMVINLERIEKYALASEAIHFFLLLPVSSASLAALFSQATLLQGLICLVLHKDIYNRLISAKERQEFLFV